MAPLTPELSIVLPVYSEARNIDVTITEIVKNLAPLEIPYEIIFVDDGSEDDS